MRQPCNNCGYPCYNVGDNDYVLVVYGLQIPYFRQYVGYRVGKYSKFSKESKDAQSLTLLCLIKGAIH